MRKNFALFLFLPYFLFATIEVSTEEKTTAQSYKKKQETLQKNDPTTTEQRLDEDNIENEHKEPTMASPMFQNSNYQKQFFRTLIFICVLIVFCLIIIYIYKKGAPMSSITKRNSKNNIKILERRSLSPQTYLYHIQVGDKQFILSESKVEVRCVSTLDWPERK